MPINHLDPDHILNNWRHSRQSTNSNWISVPIGKTEDGDVRKLVFAAHEDGVHGMIAGTTGSGKSELLTTLILGLALRYDPSNVNFALVDYKGGTAFEKLRDLPHVVDIITNLHGADALRAFTAFQAEMNRRMVLLRDARCDHILQYHFDGHHQRQPLPFLFIIVDEFAELIKENPYFRKDLESIVRLGRSLGVHLILAAQSPANVISDQMRANIKWRICLRVETSDDSRGMLGRSDARDLPPSIPGRAYIQIGNEFLELIQTAYSSGPYHGKNQQIVKPIIWHNHNVTSDQPKTPSKFPPLSDVLVDICRQLAEEYPDEIHLPHKPWADPLPSRLSIAALASKASSYQLRTIDALNGWLSQIDKE